MFRLWIKEWKDNRLVNDTVVEDDRRDTRTHKVLRGLEEGCRRLEEETDAWRGTRNVINRLIEEEHEK